MFNEHTVKVIFLLKPRERSEPLKDSKDRKPDAVVIVKTCKVSFYNFFFCQICASNTNKTNLATETRY